MWRCLLHDEGNVLHRLLTTKKPQVPEFCLSSPMLSPFFAATKKGDFMYLKSIQLIGFKSFVEDNA